MYKYEDVSFKLNQNHEKYDLVSYNNMNIRYKGIYGISIDDVKNFAEYNNILEQSAIFEHIHNIPYRSNLLYIGTAKKNNSSIGERLFGYQLGGKLLNQDPDTFRAIFYRKLGSVLGFISPCPRKNFRFTSSDDELIRKWIIRIGQKYSAISIKRLT